MNKEKKEKLKLFELKGTLRFYAKDLDDAFRIIGKYYLDLSEGKDTEPKGEIGTDMRTKIVSKKNK